MVQKGTWLGDLVHHGGGHTFMTGNRLERTEGMPQDVIQLQQCRMQVKPTGDLRQDVIHMTLGIRRYDQHVCTVVKTAYVPSLHP